MHQYTYTIIVDFQNYCDISYMPKELYNKIPTVNINDIIYISPLVIYLDKQIDTIMLKKMFNCRYSIYL